MQGLDLSLIKNQKKSMMLTDDKRKKLVYLYFKLIFIFLPNGLRQIKVKDKYLKETNLGIQLVCRQLFWLCLEKVLHNRGDKSLEIVRVQNLQETPLCPRFEHSNLKALQVTGISVNWFILNPEVKGMDCMPNCAIHSHFEAVGAIVRKED